MPLLPAWRQSLLHPARLFQKTSHKYFQPRTCQSAQLRQLRISASADKQSNTDSSRRALLLGAGVTLSTVIQGQSSVAGVEGFGGKLFSSDAPARSALPAHTAKLKSGYQIPLLGFGTYKLPPEHSSQALREALDVGYRAIDTAFVYRNEAALGQTLGDEVRSGAIKREDLFVTTKLWAHQHAKAQVVPAVKESLHKLQLDYLDLLLIHWPVTDQPGPELMPSAQDTWAGMEEAVDRGLVRSLGVSNHSPEKIRAWYGDVRIPVSVNQVEVHPHWRNDRVVKWCQQQGIHVTAYAPMGSPGEMARKGNDVPNLLQEETVKSIAAKHGKTPPQVLLAWGLQRGMSVIPKASTRAHQQDDAGCLGWALPAEDFSRLSSLSFQKRYFEGSGFLNEQGPWRTYEELWDEPRPDSA